jgi:DNA repair exonuclease SbcCD ATPase subunit
MEPKNSKIFNRETMQTVSAFCESQEIKDIDQFMYLCFKQGFDIKRYGFLGKTLNEGEKYLNTDNEGEKDLSDSRKTGGEQEKWVEKEVIKEIRVEVPVEIIKEVEKIVTKIEYISDKTGETELLLKIQQLEEEISTKTTEIGTIREEFSTKTEEMENIFQNKMSKKDEELDELRHNLDILVTNNKTNMLQETLQNLRGELQQKNEQIKELEKINRELINGNQNQGYLMRGSNLNRRI